MAVIILSLRTLHYSRPLSRDSKPFRKGAKGICSFSLTEEKKEPKETATPKPLHRGFS